MYVLSFFLTKCLPYYRLFLFMVFHYEMHKQKYIKIVEELTILISIRVEYFDHTQLKLCLFLGMLKKYLNKFLRKIIGILNKRMS